MCGINKAFSMYQRICGAPRIVTLSTTISFSTYQTASDKVLEQRHTFRLSFKTYAEFGKPHSGTFPIGKPQSSVPGKGDAIQDQIPFLRPELAQTASLSKAQRSSLS